MSHSPVKPGLIGTAKHSSYFSMDFDREKEILYDELGIIGEISYDDEGEPKEPTDEGCLLKTPKIKYPSRDAVIKCRTPKKSNKLWRLNKNAALCIFNSREFTFDKYRRCETDKDRTKSSIQSLPCEILLHIFKMLDLNSLTKCMQVCGLWYTVANDSCLWRNLNLQKRVLTIADLQNLMHRGPSAVCLNSATVTNDPRSFSRLTSHAYFQGNNTTPVYSPIADNGCSPMHDPFSRVYYYEVKDLDFTNASVSPTTLCLVLTRCKHLVNVSLEDLTINHHVLGCISNFRSLARLNLTLCKEVTVAGLVEILLACTQLKELNLAWCSICRYPPDELVSCLPPSLTHLNMGGFRDTMQNGNIAEIATRCPRLQELDVSDSNHITTTAVDMLIHRLSATLAGVNLSRCYSVAPDSLLRFVNMPKLRYLDVFGIMDDSSVAALSDALPFLKVCMRPFSAIARPAPSLSLENPTLKSSIWGSYVML